MPSGPGRLGQRGWGSPLQTVKLSRQEMHYDFILSKTGINLSCGILFLQIIELYNTSWSLSNLETPFKIYYHNITILSECRRQCEEAIKFYFSKLSL